MPDDACASRTHRFSLFDVISIGIPASASISVTLLSFAYVLAETILAMPALIRSLVHPRHGSIVTYAVAPRRLTPCRAPCTMALASACVARPQCPSIIRHPASTQCRTPVGEPLYPVVRMRLSRAMTTPTAARGHVALAATAVAIVEKYWSQVGRSVVKGVPRFFRLRLG